MRFSVFDFMQKIPEKMTTRAQQQIAAAHKEVGKAKEGIAPHEKAGGIEHVPDPVTGFYPKKPRKTRWAPTEICSDPDKSKD